MRVSIHEFVSDADELELSFSARQWPELSSATSRSNFQYEGKGKRQAGCFA